METILWMAFLDSLLNTTMEEILLMNSGLKWDLTAVITNSLVSGVILDVACDKTNWEPKLEVMITMALEASITLP
ncbi:hypothetical protein WICPIJ_009695 [Wickerhamomyces pijperi]|uniref:Uncharacterized protein n=1 Tax=Wickerhamomyces pijperi TaxID=599730 RepID=A0A9P8TBT3_WICPI|nr:hypothetical protein WICPIJ_009695 [Wickerhamomyces pijperi]